MRSGFVALVGRPNAGKSTLLNCLVGAKVAIASQWPQTTRLRVMGVRHLADAQIVFVDTPGIAKPVTPLGERLNETARAAVAELEPPDVICMVLDATAPLGRGDRLIWDSLPHRVGAASEQPGGEARPQGRVNLARAAAGSEQPGGEMRPQGESAPAGPRTVVAVTKCDRASRGQIAAQLAAAAGWDAGAYFCVSGRTGDGTEALLGYLADGLSEGPAYFPPEQVTDLPEAWRVCEAVREQLLRRLSDELPYSIAVRVTEWTERRIRCDIAVERPSQRGIVIGKGGRMLREVGTAVRRELGLHGVHLELRVRVERDWQRTPDAVARMLSPQAPAAPLTLPGTAPRRSR